MKEARVICVVGLLCLIGLAQAQFTWKGLGEPSARRSAEMIVDSVNQRIVLFGGYSADGQMLHDLWQISLADTNQVSWSSLTASGGSIAGRCNATTVYDPVRRRMLVYGGSTSGGMPNDLWALDLTPGAETWEQLGTIGSPNPARTACCGIYCPPRNSMVVFGGDSGGMTGLNETWELKLDSMRWHKLSPGGGLPDRRSCAGAGYDAMNNRMLIFGGAHYGLCFSDVWALDLTSGAEQWTQLSPSGPIPTHRNAPSVGMDSRDRRLYVFGGHLEDGTCNNEIYSLQLDSIRWALLDAGGDAPAIRGNAPGVFEPFGTRFFVFGGYDNTSRTILGDTRYLSLGSLIGIREWNGRTGTGPSLSLTVPTFVTSPVRLRFTLPAPGVIDARILDLSGRVVRELWRGRTTAASGWLTWDGRDDRGRPVGVGAYCCLLSGEDQEIVGRKFTLLKEH